MKKIFRSTGLWILIILVIFFATTVLNGSGKPKKEIIYSDLVYNIKQRQVDKIEIYENKVNGTMKNGEQFTVTTLDGRDVYKEVMQLKAQYNISDQELKVAQIPTQPLPFWVTMLPTALILILIMVFWFAFLQQSQGGTQTKTP
mgnify:FL=1